jgi:hypothetical protein
VVFFRSLAGLVDSLETAPQLTLRVGFLAASRLTAAPRTNASGATCLHQTQAGAGTDAAGLRKFSACRVGPFVGGWRLGELDLFDLEWLKHQSAGPGFIARRFVAQGHGDVDVLEDAARGDAENTVGGFDEVVAFASAMLAAEMIDEAEAGTELFGFDQETRAICLPLL